MTWRDQIDNVPGHIELCNMSKDIDNEPIIVKASTDLGPEDVAAGSSTLNDCAAAFVAQMYF